MLESIGAKYSIINQAIGRCSKRIADTIKKEGFTKKSRQKMGNIKEDMSQSIAEAFCKTDCEEFILKLPKGKTYDLNKIYKATTLLLQVLMVNTVIVNVFVLLGSSLGSIIGTIVGGAPGTVIGGSIGFFSADAITAMLVAPITEESAKQISIKGGFDKEFFLIFNLFEFTFYVVDIKKAGYKLIDAVKLRVSPIVMHLTTTVIQKLSITDNIMKSMGLDPNKEEDKKKASGIGKFIGQIIHFAWNTMAVVESIPDLKQSLKTTYEYLKAKEKV